MAERGAGRPPGGRAAVVGGSGRERIFVALGSNVGRRPDNLRRALHALEDDPEVRVVGTSRLYTTSPVGYTAQREFINGVLELRTRLSPRVLLDRCQGIEARLGKNTPFRNGPRRIDIDLLLYGSRVIRARDLVVPHPRMHLRRFVLEPLAELAPRAVHPVLRRSASGLLAGLADGERVRRRGAWEKTGRIRRGGHA